MSRTSANREEGQLGNCFGGSCSVTTVFSIDLKVWQNQSVNICVVQQDIEATVRRRLLV